MNKDVGVKQFWDYEGEPVIIQKNDRGDEIRVRKVKKGHSVYTDVRTYYVDKEGNLCPGKGIAIPDDLADEVAQAIFSVSESIVGGFCE